MPRRGTPRPAAAGRRLLARGGGSGRSPAEDEADSAAPRRDIEATTHPAAARAGPHAPRVPRALGTPEASRPERRALCTPFSDTAAPLPREAGATVTPTAGSGPPGAGRPRGALSGALGAGRALSPEAGPSARDRRPAPSPFRPCRGSGTSPCRGARSGGGNSRREPRPA